MGSDLGALLFRVHPLGETVDHGVVDGILDVGIGIRPTEEAFRVGLIFGEEQAWNLRIAGIHEPPALAQVTVVGVHGIRANGA